MTLPARRETIDHHSTRRRPRLREAGPEERGGAGVSPANELLQMLENAHEPSGRQHREAPKKHPVKRFAEALLVWSGAAAILSVGYLSYETLQGPAAPAAEEGSLDFSGVASRHVQSTEGPALELSGIVRNVSSGDAEPEVLVQLAGSRVAIEEQLRLGGATLPPGAERPFTVRFLLPEGTKSVRLLPPERASARAPEMPLVSPAWTAGG